VAARVAQRAQATPVYASILGDIALAIVLAPLFALGFARAPMHTGSGPAR